MRCARCDRILAREVVAHDRGGRLVFGWCPECLAEEGCSVSEGPIARISVSERPGLRGRVRRLRRLVIRAASARSGSSRRLAALGIAGLLATWALILAYIGGVKLARPGDRGGDFLLGLAGLAALASLGFWLGRLSRSRGPEMGLKVVQVASAVIALGTLSIGVRGRLTVPEVGLIIAAIVTFGLSWAARRARMRRSKLRPKTPARS